MQLDQSSSVHGIESRIAVHESGQKMLVFTRFFPECHDEQTLKLIIQNETKKTAEDIAFLRVHLESSQHKLAAGLHNLEFTVDGVEYGLLKSELEELFIKGTLSRDFTVRKMIYERDIQNVARIEADVHAADSTSRVSFASDEAAAGMRDYYKNACENHAVLLLECKGIIVGLAGFMKSRSKPSQLNISSLAIDIPFQGRGLLGPFLKKCLQELQIASETMIAGVTTTHRLISTAEKYKISQIGILMTRAV